MLLIDMYERLRCFLIFNTQISVAERESREMKIVKNTRRERSLYRESTCECVCVRERVMSEKER